MPRRRRPWFYNVPYEWDRQGANGGQPECGQRSCRPSPKAPHRRASENPAVGLPGAGLYCRRRGAAIAAQSRTATAITSVQRNAARRGASRSSARTGKARRAASTGQTRRRRALACGARECAARPAVYAPSPAVGDPQLLPRSGPARSQGGAFLFHPAQLCSRSLPRQRGAAPLPPLATRAVCRGSGRGAAASLAAGPAILAGISASGAAWEEGQRHSQVVAKVPGRSRQTCRSSLGGTRCRRRSRHPAIPRNASQRSRPWRRVSGMGSAARPVRRYNSI